MKKNFEEIVNQIAKEKAQSTSEKWCFDFLREVKEAVKTKIYGLKPSLCGNIHGEVWWSLSLKTEDGEIIDSIALGKAMGVPSITKEKALEIAEDGVDLFLLNEDETDELYRQVSKFIELDTHGFNGHEVGGWYVMDVRSDSPCEEWNERAKNM